MSRKPRTDAVDQQLGKLESHSGTSQRGLPLSVNRAPSADLDPWVARLVAARIEAPPDNFLSCGMCNDVSYARMIQRGVWTAEGKDGLGTYQNEALLFGPHSKRMALTCTGPVAAIGVGLRPGALARLLGRKTGDLADRVERGDPLGLVEADILAEYPPGGSPEQWLARLEDRLRVLVAQVKPAPPDPISAAFEYASFVDPNIAPGIVAEKEGISLRQLERIVKRDFGMTPKKVLRRARALDLAAQLCGVGDEEEEQELLLRYFDQSHLIREFQAFFGVTPAAFRSSPRPLMTISLETRQARRLEVLERIAPDGRRPWHAGENI